MMIKRIFRQSSYMLSVLEILLATTETAIHFPLTEPLLHSKNGPPFVIGDQMTVSFCHSQGLVSQELLDCQGCFSLQGQPTGKGMSERVKDDLLPAVLDAGIQFQIVDDTPEGLGDTFDLSRPFMRDLLIFPIPRLLKRKSSGDCTGRAFSISLTAVVMNAFLDILFLGSDMLIRPFSKSRSWPRMLNISPARRPQ